jgi:hypothetical protein
MIVTGAAGDWCSAAQRRHADGAQVVAADIDRVAETHAGHARVVPMSPWTRSLRCRLTGRFAQAISDHATAPSAASPAER